VALLAGMLVAVTAFTVLTAASRTSQLRTIGTVTAHFRSAYDILVRPRGSRTELESRTGTVQPNFLSGIYGGITMAQYHEIQQIPGVQVAAPIAMVGYMMPTVPVTAELPAAAATGHDRQLYRISTTWVSGGGSVRIPQPPSFAYVTGNKLTPGTIPPYEVLPNGPRVPVCYGYAISTDYPAFSAGNQASQWCWSRVNGMDGDGGWEGLTARRPGYAVTWAFPMLVAAIDPVAEAKLDGLNRAVTSGRYLSERGGTQYEGASGGESTFPVLVGGSSGVGEYAVTQVQRLADPARPPALDPAGMQADTAAPGRTVAEVKVTAAQAYKQLLARLTGSADQDYDDYPIAYWNVGPTTYRRGPGGGLVAATLRNSPSIWSFAVPGFGGVPMDGAATAYRAIREHENMNSSSVQAVPEPAAVGEFDPGKVRVFDPLSEVPLGPYQPTAAAPANAASRKALGGTTCCPA
jgi:hypothetical protein